MLPTHQLPDVCFSCTSTAHHECHHTSFMPQACTHVCVDASSPAFGMNWVSKLLVSPTQAGNSTLLLQLIKVAESHPDCKRVTERPKRILGCQNVRNRNLAILSRSRLKMQSLAVGHVSTTSYGKPRITNQVRTPSLIALHRVVVPFTHPYCTLCATSTQVPARPGCMGEHG